MKEYEKALEAIEEAIASMSNDSANYGVLLQNKGYICMDAGRYDEAGLNLEEAIGYLKGDNRFVALSNLALVESKNGSYEKALKDIDAAVSYFRKGGEKTKRDYLIALR